MKLHVFSDTHCDLMNKWEFEDFIRRLSDKEAVDKPDVAVIAGDFSTLAPAYINQAEKHWKAISGIYNNIVYVSGNHEHWDGSFETSDKVLAELQSKYPNFKVLTSDNPITINNQRFVGDTMWFPKPLPTDPYYTNWIDHQKIYKWAPMVWDKHSQFLEKVVDELDPNDIMVSHHFPYQQSIALKYRNSYSNCYFYAREVLEKMTVYPKLAIHGHTHCPFDYYHITGTRVYCNPHGYIHEGENPNFYDNLLVTV